MDWFSRRVALAFLLGNSLICFLCVCDISKAESKNICCSLSLSSYLGLGLMSARLGVLGGIEGQPGMCSSISTHLWLLKTSFPPINKPLSNLLITLKINSLEASCCTDLAQGLSSERNRHHWTCRSLLGFAFYTLEILIRLSLLIIIVIF